MLISVVIPTVEGRQLYLDNAVRAYMAHTRTRIELIIEADHAAVGLAWQAGAEKATGDYIHLSNDDCEPHDGWDWPAIQACEEGFVPGPQVYAPDGSPQAPPVWGEVSPDWSPLKDDQAVTIPFLSRKQWDVVQPLLTVHYYSDNWIADRARAAGYRAVLRTGYAFTHHWAAPHRGAGMTEPERMFYDKLLYERAHEMLKAGQWTKPWPEGGRHDG